MRPEISNELRILCNIAQHEGILEGIRSTVLEHVGAAMAFRYSLIPSFERNGKLLEAAAVLEFNGRCNVMSSKEYSLDGRVYWSWT